ncbi:MAG: hypothetical protein QG673_313 [Pseudomonadota bacterium]|nr:hypothetical protein [Pseudomonadota bacterium]
MNSTNENTQHNASLLPEDKITLDNDISNLPTTKSIVESTSHSALKSQWYSALTNPLSNPITPPIFTALL